MNSKKNFTGRLVSFGKKHKLLKYPIIAFLLIIIFFKNLLKSAVFDKKGRRLFLGIIVAIVCIAGVATALSGNNRVPPAESIIDAAAVTAVITETPRPTPDVSISTPLPTTTAIPEASPEPAEPLHFFLEDNGTYNIYDTVGLQSFCEHVASGGYNTDATLMSDIDLENSVFQPIGCLTDSGIRIYGGCFNGNGYTISGLRIEADSEYAGFIGCLEGGTIMNLKISSAAINGPGYLGSFAGRNNGRIENCSSDGSIVCDSRSIAIGGITGINLSSISLCASTTTVTGGAYVGGIAGINSGTIDSSTNSGYISSAMSSGGIAGYNMDGIISDCVCESSAVIYAETAAGGVVGTNSNFALISSCTGLTDNIGALVGAGIICGINHGNITGCNITDGAIDISYSLPVTGIEYGVTDPRVSPQE